MAKTRMINTRFWVDDYTSNLDPIEKLLFLYFLTNPATDICGVYELPIKNIALDTGIDKEMVIKIIDRFSKDGKIFYKKGWVAIKNFTKHQANNPKVQKGIEIGLNKAPKEILDSLSNSIYSLSHLNSNLNSNAKTATAAKITAEEEEFSLSKEIQKLEESPHRHLNIIAWYLSERKPKFENKQQFNIALRRHLRSAKDLVPFTDEQITGALFEAKKLSIGWTLETIVKVLTK